MAVRSAAKVTVGANLNGLEGFIGGVGGFIKAMENPRFQGDFVDHLMNKTKKQFTAHTIASSGRADLKHVFEWGPQVGGVATGGVGVPLFRLTKAGRAGKKEMSYHFMPSTQPVPLPNPSKTGFDPGKLDHMKRHIFKYKAIIMETNAQVTISPTFAKALFIPSTRSEDGYVMTKKSVTFNPGGPEATGGFAQWWTTFFETMAPAIVQAEQQSTEEFIKKTGQKVLRNAAGRFASRKGSGISYIGSAKRTAELETLTAAKNYFSDGPVDWDGE